MIINDTSFTNLKPREFLKALSSKDFRIFGMEDGAYIRPIKLADGDTEYAIHAADGTPLSVMESMDSAMSAARHNELEPLTLH